MFVIFKLVSNMYYHVDPINYQIMNYLIIKSLVRYLKKSKLFNTQIYNQL